VTTGGRSDRRGVFVTGTDTGVGKTLVSALLLAALRAAGGAAGYFKPVQTGAEDDTREVARLAGVAFETLPRPAYALRLPAAPSRAAAAEQVRIDPAVIAAAWRRLPAGRFVVEGAGGLLVPLTERDTMRDLVARLDLPLLVVASTRLGTINHTLLTLEAARRGGLAVAGLVLNGDPDPGLAGVLAGFDGAPVLAEVPRLADLSPDAVARRGPEIFGPAALRLLFEASLPGPTVSDDDP
jgi:malonyl-CoA O-methyltransferase